MITSETQENFTCLPGCRGDTGCSAGLFFVPFVGLFVVIQIFPALMPDKTIVRKQMEGMQ